MQRDALATFTDRHEANALFEYICEHIDQPERPLPFLTFLAPGGGGKSTLIDLLVRRCSKRRPYARLDFTQTNAKKTFLDVLRDIFYQLCRFDKELIFPHFDTGRHIVFDKLPDDKQLKPHEEIVYILTEALPSIHRLDEMGQKIGNLFPMIPPLQLLVKWGLQTQTIQSRLWRPVLEWYQQHSHLLRPHDSTSAIDTLIHLRALSSFYRQQGQPAANSEGVERLLFAAFLDDLRDAYHKTPRVILFLDGFEAIANDANGMGMRLLTMLTQHRKEGKADPLLLVIGSQQRLFEPLSVEQNPSFEEEHFMQNEGAVQQYVHQRYDCWLRQLPSDANNLRAHHLYLPLWLHDFEQVYSRTYLSQLGQQERQPFIAQEKLIEKFYSTAHGHPLTLIEVAKAVQEAQQRPSNPPLDIFQEIVHESMRQTIADYLGSVFFRELSTAEQEHLVLCAAPRTLDAGTLQVILQLPDQKEAEKRLAHYQRLTFISTVKNCTMLHPVARQLLLKQLQQDDSTYESTHTHLCSYFDSPTQIGNDRAQIEQAYHALALGDPKLAIRLAIAHSNDNAFLDQIWKMVAEAPTKLIPSDARKWASNALHLVEQGSDIQNGVIALVFYRWLVNVLDQRWLINAPYQDQLEAYQMWNNLGKAYLYLPIGDQKKNQEEARKCFVTAQNCL